MELLELPAELIALIVIKVGAYDFENFALTCHALYSYCQPRVKVHHDRKRKYSDIRAPTNETTRYTSTAGFYAYHLIHNPEYAQYVRTLELLNDDYDPKPEFATSEDFNSYSYRVAGDTNAELMASMSDLQLIGLMNACQLTGSLEDYGRQRSALAEAFLPFLCPNLRKLTRSHMKDRGSKGSSQYETALSDAARLGTSVLPRLREVVSEERYDEWLGVASTHIAGWLHIPSLEKLKANFVVTRAEDESLMPLLERTGGKRAQSSLKVFQIGGELRPTDLENLFESLPLLHTFQYVDRPIRSGPSITRHSFEQINRMKSDLRKLSMVSSQIPDHNGAHPDHLECTNCFGQQKADRRSFRFYRARRSPALRPVAVERPRVPYPQSTWH